MNNVETMEWFHSSAFTVVNNPEKSQPCWILSKRHKSLQVKLVKTSYCLMQNMSGLDYIQFNDVLLPKCSKKEFNNENDETKNEENENNEEINGENENDEGIQDSRQEKQDRELKKQNKGAQAHHTNNTTVVFNPKFFQPVQLFTSEGLDWWCYLYANDRTGNPIWSHWVKIPRDDKENYHLFTIDDTISRCNLVFFCCSNKTSSIISNYVISNCVTSLHSGTSNALLLKEESNAVLSNVVCKIDLLTLNQPFLERYMSLYDRTVTNETKQISSFSLLATKIFWCGSDIAQWLKMKTWFEQENLIHQIQPVLKNVVQTLLTSLQSTESKQIELTQGKPIQCEKDWVLLFCGVQLHHKGFTAILEKNLKSINCEDLDQCNVINWCKDGLVLSIREKFLTSILQQCINKSMEFEQFCTFLESQIMFQCFNNEIKNNTNKHNTIQPLFTSPSDRNQNGLYSAPVETLHLVDKISVILVWTNDSQTNDSKNNSSQTNDSKTNKENVTVILQQLLKQTYTNKEIIFVFNDYNDEVANTLKLQLQEMEKLHKNCFKLITAHQELSVIDCQKMALLNTTGSFVLFHPWHVYSTAQRFEEIMSAVVQSNCKDGKDMVIASQSCCAYHSVSDTYCFPKQMLKKSLNPEVTQKEIYYIPTILTLHTASSLHSPHSTQSSSLSNSPHSSQSPHSSK